MLYLFIYLRIYLFIIQKKKIQRIYKFRLSPGSVRMTGAIILVKFIEDIAYNFGLFSCGSQRTLLSTYYTENEEATTTVTTTTTTTIPPPPPPPPPPLLTQQPKL